MKMNPYFFWVFLGEVVYFAEIDQDYKGAFRIQSNIYDGAFSRQ